MPDSNQDRKKKKITIAASTQGIEIAEKALVRLGFNTKDNFAKSNLLAPTTVSKFFNRQPIQVDSFKRICEALKLNWEDIIRTTGENNNPEQVESQVNVITNSVKEAKPMKTVETITRQITIEDPLTKTEIVVLTLKGELNSVHNIKMLTEILRNYSGNTISIIDIQKGSIKLIIEGSQEDIDRLVSQIQSGKLTKIGDFPVEDAQILSQSSEDDESSNKKWHLVEEIVTTEIDNRDLSGVDLSDADLSNAYLNNAKLNNADLSDSDLNDANLRGADLSNADLSDANLSFANLSGTNLSGANLSGANLSGANLSDANLSGANLSDANLSGANLIVANLSGADLSGANLSDANLSDANLSGADLRGADLIVADLIVAKLSGAKLSGANLIIPKLSGANLIVVSRLIVAYLIVVSAANLRVPNMIVEIVVYLILASLIGAIAYLIVTKLSGSPDWCGC